MKLNGFAIAVATLAVGCSGGVGEGSAKFDELPRAVQAAVKTHAPNSEIASVERDMRDGRIVYEIEFKDRERTPKMLIAHDGTILASDAVGGTGPGAEAVRGSGP